MTGISNNMRLAMIAAGVGVGALAVAGVVASVVREAGLPGEPEHPGDFRTKVDPPGVWNSRAAHGHEDANGNFRATYDPPGWWNDTRISGGTSRGHTDARIDGPGWLDNARLELSERRGGDRLEGKAHVPLGGSWNDLVVKLDRGRDGRLSGYVAPQAFDVGLNRLEVDVWREKGGWHAVVDPLGPWNETHISGRGTPSDGAIVSIAMASAIETYTQMHEDHSDDDERL